MEIPVLEFFFSRACNFIKNKLPPRLFYFKICKIFKNTYFEEHFRKVAST